VNKTDVPKDLEEEEEGEVKRNGQGWKRREEEELSCSRSPTKGSNSGHISPSPS